jgi:hypothetical protein
VTGLEYGYLMNVYPPERNDDATFRWTNGNGLIRLTVPAAGAGRLIVWLNGSRVAGAPAGRVELAVDGRVVDAFAADGSWQTRSADLTPLRLSPGQTVLIEVRSDAYVPAGLVPGNRDGRRLGVALDRIALESP